MIRHFVLIASALLAGCQAEKAAEPTGPDGFAYAASVEPQGSASLQKVELPAAALIALQRTDLGDVRIFDGRGKVLPIARLDPAGGDAQQTRDVAIYPIAGTAAASGSPVVSIELAQPGQTVSVETHGAAAASENAAVLADTRAITDPAAALVLDAQLPAQTPVTFTIEASADLKDWQFIADKVLFSPGEGQDPLGGTRIALAGVSLEKRYLRVSWKAIPGVAVKGARIVTAKAAPAARVGIATTGARLDDAHSLHFTAPFVAPLAAIDLAGTDADGVVPVRLFGRETIENPWMPLSAAIVRPGGKPATFELGGVRYGQYKIEADPRSAGFSKPPALMLQAEPLTLLTAFNGQPPYRLAVGKAEAEGKLFAPGELAEPKAWQGELPSARIDAAPPAVIALDAGAADSPFTARKLALWAALLLGTALLAWGAIRMLRANAPDQSAS